MLALLLGLGWGGWWLLAPTPESWLRQGRLALGQHDLTEAERLAEKLEAHNYRDQALLLRGEIQVRRGQFPQALLLFNQIRDQGDLRLEAVALTGRCLLQLGDLLEAERAFSYLLSQRPESLDAHRGLAAVYCDQGALALAVQHGEEWARLDAADGRPARMMGLIAKDLGQFRQAVERYESALARNLKEHVKDEVRQELAECLLRLHNYARALEVLDGITPTSYVAPQALVVRAACLRGLGRGPEALVLAEKAAAADPRNAEAPRLRGQLLLEADRVKEALSALETAAALAPGDYQTHFLLAQAYTRMNRTQSAQEEQQKAKELGAAMDELTKLTRDVMEHPKDAALHTRMAELYEKLSMREMAARSKRTARYLTLSTKPAAGP